MLHLHGFTRAFLVQKPNLNVHINTLNRLCMQRKTHLISLSLIRSSFSLSNPNENANDFYYSNGHVPCKFSTPPLHQFSSFFIKILAFPVGSVSFSSSGFGSFSTRQTWLLSLLLLQLTSEEFTLMVDAMFSTISMATSLRSLGSMFLLFALWEEEHMVLFGKEETFLWGWVFVLAEFICFLCCFCCLWGCFEDKGLLFF